MLARRLNPEDVVKSLRACTNTRKSLAARCNGCPYADLECTGFSIKVVAADTIEELLAQVRWIPVGEKLPELIPCNAVDGHGYSEAVQICTDGKKVLTAVYSDLGWIFDEGFWNAWDETVTHWRPVVGNLPWAGEGV